jgi:hypothetical protein
MSGAAVAHARRGARVLQTRVLFRDACTLLELYELRRAHTPPAELERVAAEFAARFGAADVDRLLPLANARLALQLAEMFQHLWDLDAGDTPAPPVLASASASPAVVAPLPPTAADAPSIGPSSHTNPLPTLDLAVRSADADARASASIAARRALTARVGFSLWLGPSQSLDSAADSADSARSFDDATSLPRSTGARAPGAPRAGLYLRGFAEVGAVVALYPGAVFGADMRQRASDVGHWGNAAVPRLLVPRPDGAVLDVWAGGAWGDAGAPPRGLSSTRSCVCGPPLPLNSRRRRRSAQPVRAGAVRAPPALGRAWKRAARAGRFLRRAARRHARARAPVPRAPAPVHPPQLGREVRAVPGAARNAGAARVHEGEEGRAEGSQWRARAGGRTGGARDRAALAAEAHCVCETLPCARSQGVALVATRQLLDEELFLQETAGLSSRLLALEPGRGGVRPIVPEGEQAPQALDTR